MRFMKTSLFLLVVMFILSACVSIPLGDGAKLKVSKNGIEFTDEEGGQHSFEFDEESEQLTMKGFGMEEGEGEIKIGENLEIPKDFPSDIPLTDDAIVFQVSDAYPVISVTYYTEEIYVSVDSMYEEYFNSAAVTESESMAEKNDLEFINLYTANKGDGKLSVQIMDIEDEERTVVMIVYDAESNEE